MEDVTRNNFGRLDFIESAAAENSCLQGQSLLELVDNGTRLEFLDETDGCVEQKQGANNTEIYPILEASSENGGGLS